MHTAFKLGLVTSAVMLTFSAAQAANVELYGSVSTGFVVKHTNVEGEKKTSSAMESGWYGDSNWGLTGSEDLGNGWKAGFKVESNFESDTGSGSEDGLFDSQSYLTIGNDMVTLVAGRLGGLASGGGDFDMLGGYDPLEAKFGIAGLGLFATRDLTANNSLAAVVTPVDGLTVTGVVSMGVEEDSGKWGDRAHYYALGATYEVDAFAGSLIWERVTLPEESKHSNFYTLGLSYDFGMVKPMLAYQHGHHVSSGIMGGAYVSVIDTLPEPTETFDPSFQAKMDSFLLGATVPMMGGNLMVSAQYATGKIDNTDMKFNAKVLGVAYDYPLSKRTSVYTGATWSKGGKLLAKDSAVAHGHEDFNGWQFGVGLKHAF